MSDANLPSRILLKNGRRVKCTAEPGVMGYRPMFQAEDGKILNAYEHAESLMAFCQMIQNRRKASK